MMGHILQLQQRLVIEERARQDVLTEQAAADERRRIAREVHDVIAHSLSVTMLHLTGARRALQEDSDVDEAVDGLPDAERLGRQAMSDIRQTVGLFGARDAAPLRLALEPGLSDLPGLVTSFADAGLHVESSIEVDPASVTPGIGPRCTCGAGVTANVAKHAPSPAARLRLYVEKGAAVLSVDNELPRPWPAQQPVRGLGMRQRIALLDGEFEAGPVELVYNYYNENALDVQTIEGKSLDLSVLGRTILLGKAVDRVELYNVSGVFDLFDRKQQSYIGSGNRYVYSEDSDRRQSVLAKNMDKQIVILNMKSRFLLSVVFFGMIAGLSASACV